MRTSLKLHPSNRLWEIAGLCVVLTLALTLRVHFLQSVHHDTSPDASNYVQMADQLLERGVLGYKSELPNAYVTPGFPLVLAGIFAAADAIGQDRLAAVRYFHVWLSTFQVLLLYVMARQTAPRGIRETAAWIAAAAAAIYPAFIWANGASLTEVLACFGFTLYLYLQLLYFRYGGWQLALATGAAMGGTVLIRPEFLPVLGIAYLFHALRSPDRTKVLAHGAAAAAGFVLVLAPWWIRNALVLDQFVLLSSQTNPFYAGTFPYNDYSVINPEETGKTELQLAIERIRNGFLHEPKLFLWWYTFGKLEYVYAHPFIGTGHSPLYPVVPFYEPFHRALVWLGAAAAAAALFVRRSDASFLALTVIAMTLIRLVFVPEFRYNFTIMPILIVMASLGVGWLLHLLYRMVNRQNSR